jgi:small GTP-binding protein
MTLINYSSKEVTLKIVYYGPGLSGKTTNLQRLHSQLAPERRGKLLSLATETDRTLFFDFMPVDLGKVGGFGIRFQLYTVPGQVRYNATRRLVLKGADAVVFVADSQEALRDQNVESYDNMLENFRANNLDPEDIPIVLQYNKRDLDQIMSVEEMDSILNPSGHPTMEAEAISGKGVNDTFKLVTSRLIKHMAVKHRLGLAAPEAPVAEKKAPPRAEPRPAAAPPPPLRAPEPPDLADEPKMPALSEVADTAEVDAVFGGPRKALSKELPPLEYLSKRRVSEAPRRERPAAPPEAAPGDIERDAESILRALEGVTRELKASMRNQEEMLDLLRKIESSLRSNSGE